MGLIPSLLEDSDSKDVKSFEEAEDIAALGAVAFFGKLGLVQIIQRSHIMTAPFLNFIRSRFRNGVLLFCVFFFFRVIE